MGALGVVYGDIGTSPIYTLRECLKAAPSSNMADSVFGLLSLIFWSLMIVVTGKYVVLVMRADNEGEGGIIALLGLAAHSEPDQRRRTALLLFGLAGAALFYGDGMITPAISVLSAVEGLKVATPALADYVVPLSVIVLVGLFILQTWGSARIGAYFGPVMALWFAALAVAGLFQVVQNPGILVALNSLYALRFLAGHGWAGFLALGSVYLALTGAEALYADMGHFGRGPIRFDWFGLVLPALVLNYFGQGALVLAHPEAGDSPFYHLFPGRPPAGQPAVPKVRDMVAELSVRHALPRDVMEDVAASTGGVPLFVEEVTRLLLDRGEGGGGTGMVRRPSRCNRTGPDNSHH